MIVAASRRPRCYFPSPSLLDDDHITLVAMLMPGVQAVREVGRSLPVRAMWHAGENRPDEAWRDLEAVHTLSRLVAQGPTVIDQLVGNAISGMACDATITFLHESKPSRELAREINAFLAGLPQFNGAADTVNHFERLSYLSTIVDYSKHGISRDELNELQLEDPFNIAHHATVDWNLLLARGNEK